MPAGCGVHKWDRIKKGADGGCSVPGSGKPSLAFPVPLPGSLAAQATTYSGIGWMVGAQVSQSCRNPSRTPNPGQKPDSDLFWSCFLKWRISRNP